jgi:hypothetical protein
VCLGGQDKTGLRMIATPQGAGSAQDGLTFYSLRHAITLPLVSVTRRMGLLGWGGLRSGNWNRGLSGIQRHWMSGL